MLNPTVFIDTTAIALRAVEVPAANFANGCNNSASSSMGIGINIGGGPIVGTPQQFTLDDQRGLSRTAQISQSIGGFPYANSDDYPSSGGLPGTEPNDFIITGTMPTKAQKDADSSLDGTLIFNGEVFLVNLVDGWVSVLEVWQDILFWNDTDIWNDLEGPQ